MRYHLFGVIICAGLVLSSGTASAQPVIPIDDIQNYNPADGSIASPYAGQVVTIEGVIYVVNNTYNNGSHYIMDDTGGIAYYYPSAPTVDYGDRVQVTGLVDEFSGEIQIEQIQNVAWLGHEASPDSVEVPIAELVNSTVNPNRYEWVGNFIYCIGYVTNKGASNFYLHNQDGDTIQVYIDETTLIDIENVDEGDEYKVVSPCVNYQGEIELKPRRQSDLIENPSGDTVPVIANVNCYYNDLTGNPPGWCPEEDEPIEVRAIITDDILVSSATLHFRDDAGDSSGAFTAIAMTNIGGDTYRATIPPPHPEIKVDFYISATDNADQTTTNPGNAPAGWFEVAVGFTRIYELQYVHPDTFSHVSPYIDKVVNIRGIVTAGTNNAGPSSRFVMQEADPTSTVILDGVPTPKPDIPEFAGPDYRWGGILVYESSGSYDPVFEGDLVQVGGYVDEYFNLTEMNPHNGSAVYFLSFGNPLPKPMYARTRDFADDVWMDDGNGRYGEAFESCWVRSKAALVMSADAFGGFTISDTGALEDSLEVDPERTLSYVPIVDDVVIIEGFIDYDFGDFQIAPFLDLHIVSGLVGVEDWTPQDLPSAGGFTAIAPNPFNPKAEIRFVVTRPNLTQLNVYDIRGNLVRTLVHERLPAKEHTFHWDGTNSAGQHVASGTYFARLRIGGEVMQIRKISLVK